MTVASKKAIPELGELEQVLYIQFFIQFSKKPVQAFINLKNKVNIIEPSFAKKLGLCIRKTKVDTQKIDGSRFETFGMIRASFLIDDKIKKYRFFEKTFLLADISMNVAFGILFLTLNDAKINFNNQKLK